MKAVRIHSYGGHEVLVLEEAPIPDIADDEVLIRVRAAAVNPVDWKVRAGFLQEMLSYRFPLILGWDVSGTVAKAGSGASGLREGDDVYALPDISRDGSYAEYVAVKAATVAPKPRSIDHVQAASVPLAGLTAWQSLFDAADLQGGQSVLIQAAAGGVGSFAVQFARWRGARVLGTASARNRDFLIDLGADEVIDYTRTPFEEVTGDLDVVLDAMGGRIQERSWQVLKKGGVLVSIVGPPDREKAAEYGVRGEGVFVQPSAAQLTSIAELIDGGQIRTNVTEVLTLAEAARAHELSETEHVRGKIVLKVD
ncbi:MAG: NADP-dependent oxidoreductase [bacterium]|nr:MAG: NADP-dependent oxidoreductase [bacterium]